MGPTGNDPTGLTGIATGGGATGDATGATGATGTLIGTCALPVSVQTAAIAKVAAIVSVRHRWLVMAKVLGERCSVICNLASHGAA